MLGGSGVTARFYTFVLWRCGSRFHSSGISSRLLGCGGFNGLLHVGSDGHGILIIGINKLTMHPEREKQEMHPLNG